jgi:hypothetical protein
MAVSMAFHDLNLAEQFLTLTDFEAQAEKSIRPDVWGFVAGGAGDEISLRWNTAWQSVIASLALASEKS